MAGKQLSKEKFGYVALTSHETKVEGRRMDYFVRWRAPETRKDVKRLLTVVNKDEARAEARRINVEVTKQRARLHLMPVAAINHLANAPTLREAIEEAIAARNRRKPMSPGHLYNLHRYKEKFLDFLQERFPKLEHWKDLRRSPHVAAWVEQMQDAGLKPGSIRHCLEVASLTSNYFADEHEEFGYRTLRVLRIAPELEEPKKKYMTIEQLEQAIAISREMGSVAAEMGFLLGGWCGLNLREIARLTTTDFDFQHGLLTIQKSKNKYRKRTIPLPSFVLDVVQAHMKAQKVIDVSGSLFIRSNGQPADNRYLGRPMDVVLHRMGIRYESAEAARAAKAANVPEDYKAPETVIVPMNVRKTFINLAIAAGCEREVLRRYVGHVPSDVMSAHYEDFTLDRFRAEVVNKVKKFRELSLSNVAPEYAHSI